MKIAIHFPYLYPWILDLTHELSNKGNEVKCYTTGIYGNFPWKQYEKYAHLMPRVKILGEIFPSPQLIVNFLQYRPQLLLLFASESFASLFMYILSKFLRIHVILFVEQNAERTFNSDFMIFLAKIKKRLVKFVHIDAQIIIAESEASRKYLLQMGCSPERISTLTHGTNIKYFKPKPKSIDFASELGISQEVLKKKIIILFAAEFSEVKGAEYLAKAIFNLSQRRDIFFLIPSFGEIFYKYEELFRKSINVCLYPPLPFINMPKIYNLADIIIVPSKLCDNGSSDRSPNSLIEGMACGKAIIGTLCGGIPTIMGNAGLLIPPNDPEAIVEAILMLSQDKNLIKTLGEKARERAMNVLDNKKYAAWILDL